MTTEMVQRGATEVAKAPQIKSVDDLVKSPDFQSQIARALPQTMTADRYMRLAATLLRRTPKLAECSVASFASCLLDCAQLGLEPGGALGRAYLVPYKDVCTLIIGYRGLIELAFRSGKLLSIMAAVVHENDIFELEMGLTEKLRHIPALEDRGEPTQVYAVARLVGGATIWTHMSRAEVDAIRARSKASGSGPWVTDWNQMACKTAIRRLSKVMPMATEADLGIEAEDRSHIDAGLYSERAESPRLAALRAKAGTGVSVDAAPAEPESSDPYELLAAALKQLKPAQRRALEAAVGSPIPDDVSVLPLEYVEHALREAVAIRG